MIIPCYNHNNLVVRAVYSAIQQTYGDKEVIVVDDGSSNPIRNVWGGYIRVIRHEVNQGLSAALNTGVAAAIGDRYIVLAADDELRPDCLAKLALQDADIVACDFKGDRGEPVTCRAADLQTLITANCHSYAALVRKNMWQKVGGYKDINPSWEDWEFWLNCAKHGATWAYVPEALHIYHRNPSGRDADSQTKMRLLNGQLHGYHQDLYGRGKGVVAFIIPCYNQEKWLPYALESVAKQTYPHKVAVVVDDGSKGDVAAAIWPSKPLDVLLVRQKNAHLSAARNTGINYALNRYSPEYMIMLDADDGLTPDYVETLMGAMPVDGNTYVYTDVQFMGDAWHDHVLPDYNCETLTQQHIHPCTFLAPSQLYQDVERSRGYIYDEDMKQGYEDWEFALAALKAGWGGLRVPKLLFQYRYHAGGSMRTQAADINSELSRYIINKHSWVRNKEALMACGGCGANRVRRRSINKNGGLISMLYNVPGVGTFEGDQQVVAVYSGPTSSRITKLGVGDTMYRYSNNPNNRHGPRFPIYARDIHLFAGGPFQFYSINAVSAPLAVVTDPVVNQPALAVAELPPVDDTFDRLSTKIAGRPIIEIKNGDDLSQLGLTSDQADNLLNAGFAFYADVVDATDEELALVLSISNKKAGALKIRAGELE